MRPVYRVKPGFAGQQRWMTSGRDAAEPFQNRTSRSAKVGSRTVSMYAVQERNFVECLQALPELQAHLRFGDIIPGPELSPITEREPEKILDFFRILLVINLYYAFSNHEQNTSVEVLITLGRLINLPDLLVSQEPDHLVQTQARSRKGWPPQLFKHTLFSLLGRNDK